MREYKREELRKAFPNLMREIEEASLEEKITMKIDRSRGYEPTVIDFIRRCDSNEEAIEIIDFLEKRGEISKEYAEALRTRIRKKGVRSFGKKRKPGYYFRAFGRD
ncbi:MAG: DUF2095 family protein [Candidatus Methanomethyliaceae archaeon]|nr:DUF2095 family protein [Candidatus Methanomethyliaceae archaeon]